MLRIIISYFISILPYFKCSWLITLLEDRATQPVTCVVNLHIFAVVTFTCLGSCNVYAAKILTNLLSFYVSWGNKTKKLDDKNKWLRCRSRKNKFANEIRRK